MYRIASKKRENVFFIIIKSGLFKVKKIDILDLLPQTVTLSFPTSTCTSFFYATTNPKIAE